MNDKERYVVGVDIGTTKICAVVASADELDRIHVRGVGVAPSEGLNRGVVVNIDKTVAAVKQAVEEAERSAGVDTQSVVVGIAGDHIQSFQSRGVITVAGGEIGREDVKRLLEDTKHVAMPADREILHVLPQEFIVDGQDGVADPIGMSGVRLEANVHIITGLVSAAKNVYRCIEKAGYAAGDQIKIALDCAATEFYDADKGVYALEGKSIDSDGMVGLLAEWTDQYPICSIEDGCSEDDWDGWKKLTDTIGDRCQLVGDDLFVTNTKRLSDGIDRGVANSILVKVNQIGTLTETIEAVQMAGQAGYTAVMSHRSGETEDTTIADLAVALRTGQIKTGSASRTDRICKYNQLLRIEEILGSTATFGGTIS